MKIAEGALKNKWVKLGFVLVAGLALVAAYFWVSQNQCKARCQYLTRIHKECPSVFEIYKNPRPIDHFDEIVIEHTHCLMSCPRYKISIQQDGHVSFTDKGSQYSKPRSAEKSLSKEEIQEIIVALNKSGLISIASSWYLRLKTPGCFPGAGVYEGPSTIITLRLNNEEYSIEHSNGALLPEQLPNIEQTIESIVGVPEWIGAGAWQYINRLFDDAKRQLDGSVYKE